MTPDSYPKLLCGTGLVPMRTKSLRSHGGAQPSHQGGQARLLLFAWPRDVGLFRMLRAKRNGVRLHELQLMSIVRCVAQHG
eukprot:3621342-Amphidinium_carterae.1